MAQDSAGNIFVIDYGNSRLQKFSQAGDHLLTFQDYGSGTSQLNRPSDIVVDASNDIYVSDSSLATITKFDNEGNFLLAFGSNGTGEGQFRSGIRDMAVGNDGNIYAVDNHIDGNVVHVFSPTGTWLRTIGTPGTGYGQLEDVRHIAFDSQGLLYVINSATYSGYKMSVFDQDGVFVKQYELSANVNGNYYHPNPNSLEFDKYDNMYMGIQTDGGIGVWNKDGRFLYKYGEELEGYYSGEGASTQVNGRDLHFMISPVNNEMYLSGDHDFIQIYKIAYTVTTPSAPLNMQVSQAGSGKMLIEWETPETNGGAPIESYVIEYQPSVYGEWVTLETVNATTRSYLGRAVDDVYDIRVRAVNNAGLGAAAQVDAKDIYARYGFQERIDTRDNGGYRAFAFDKDDNRYALDYENHKVDIFDKNGVYIKSFGTYGGEPEQFNYPRHIVISDDQKVYIADSNNSRVQILDLDGHYISSFGVAGTDNGQFYSPQRLAFDSAGDLYVLDYGRSIQKFDRDGVYKSRLGSAMSYPTSIAVDSNDNVFVSNFPGGGASGIYKFDASGTQTLKFGSEGDDFPDQFWSADGMVVNHRDELIVNDTWNYRLAVFTNDGQFLEDYGRGYGNPYSYLTFSEAQGLDIDNQGKLYVGDMWSTVNSYQIFYPTNPPIANISAPTIPRNQSGESTRPSEIDLTWNHPESNGGSEITNYLIRYREDSSETNPWYEAVIAGDKTSHTITHLAGGKYDLQIIAINAAGQSPAALVNDIEVVASAGNKPIPTPAPAPAPAPEPKPGETTTNEPTEPRPDQSAPSISDVYSGSVEEPFYTEVEESVKTSDDKDDNKTEVIDITQSNNVIFTKTDAEAGNVTLTWESPTDPPADAIGYVIETRRQSQVDWSRNSQVDADARSADVKLTPGDYNVRVAALFPEEHKQRIIVGTAVVSLQDCSPLLKEQSDAAGILSLASIATFCVGAVAGSAFFFVPFAFMRRRKQDEAGTPSQFPPRPQF